MAWPNLGTSIAWNVFEYNNTKQNVLQQSVWSDLAKFRKFSKNFEIFGNISKVYLIFGKVVNPLWDFMSAFGQNFIVVNGQILKKKQSSHWVTLAATQVSWLSCCCWYCTAHTQIEKQIQKMFWNIKIGSSLLYQFITRRRFETRYLEYFSIFGHLQQRKIAQLIKMCQRMFKI